MVTDPRGTRLGNVATFDEAAGYGELVSGDARWFFHCTAIADGSRAIEVGTAVRFRLTPGHLGRHEATDIAPA